ncbi:MAG: hypothetical protein ACRDZX_17670 [Acidimicrobiales bacterium]
MAATAVAVVFCALRVLVAGHGQVGALVLAGSAHVSPTRYTRSLPIVNGAGYDGQFYYRLALGPLDWSPSAFGIHLDTLGRLDRVAYPALAWAAAAGRASAVPVALLAVNVVALGALAGLAGALAREAGRQPLSGLLVAGFFGLLWSLSRDLTELTEAVFVVAALLAVRKGRPVLAGLLLSVAVLAREPALVLVGALFVARAWAWAHPGGAQGDKGQPGAARPRTPGPPTPGLTTPGPTVRRPAPSRAPGRPDATWVLPTLTFAGWQLALHARTGTFPALTSGHNNAGAPFVGLAAGLTHYLERLPRVASLLWAGELGVLAVVATLAAISLSKSTAALHERIAWAAGVVLAVLLVRGVWLGDVGFRSLDDLWVFSSVLVLFSRLRLGLAAWLAAAGWCVVAIELVVFI